MKYDTIIFDLDGTLLDTSRGIFNSVRYAERMLNLPPVEDETLRRFVGPPPKSMYMEIYGLDEKTAETATLYHRQYGKERGFCEAELYPDVKSVLRDLKDKGYHLTVATLKAQSVTDKVLSYFSIDQFFDKIIGMNPQENLTKQDTIELSIAGITSFERALMVGDSLYDMLGAKDAGVDFLAALYGFGFNDLVNDTCCIGNVYRFSDVLLYI